MLDDVGLFAPEAHPLLDLASHHEALTSNSSDPFGLGTVALFATDSIALDTDVLVQSGDIVVNEVGGTLDLKQGVITEDGVNLFADHIKIGKGAQVGGHVSFNHLDNDGLIGGNQNSPLVLPVLFEDELLTFNEGTPGIQDIYVDSGQTQRITPGDYDDIEVESDGTLIFDGAGVYTIDSIIAAEGTHLLFEAEDDVELRIEAGLRTDKDTTVGPAAGAEIDASDIIFFIESTGSGKGGKFAGGGKGETSTKSGKGGKSPGGGKGGKSPGGGKGGKSPGGGKGGKSAGIGKGEVLFGERNDIDATIYLFDGTLTFERDTTATGAFFAPEIQAKRDVVFELDSYFSDQDPPDITAALVNDTGQSAIDGITGDPTIAGQITDASEIVSFWAGFEDAPIDAYVEVSSFLQPDGSFTFDRATLDQIYGGELPNGPHTLNLVAMDAAGNISGADLSNGGPTVAVPFVLDTVSPVLTLDLDPASDSDPVGDQQTTLETVTLVGQSEPGLMVELVQTGGMVVVDAAGQFRFTHVALVEGDNLFTFETMDVAGNRGEFSQTIQRVQANQAPTELDLVPASIAEHQPAGTVVGRFSTADPDVEDTHTYTLVAGEGDTGNASFEIEGDQLFTLDEPDFETQSSYSIRVQTQDAAGEALEQVFTIAVTDVNEAPTDLALTANDLTENVPDNSLVGALSTVDPDLDDSHTYALVAGAGDTDNAAFTLTDNQLHLSTSPDFEAQASYSIRVRSSDQAGLSTEKILTIGIVDANEAPTQLVLSDTTIAENSPEGTVIGTFTSLDPDANDTHTYDLVNQDGNLFAIVGSQLQVAPGALFNFEAATTHTITVRTTDAGGLSTTQQLAITVTDVNEAPQTITLAPDQIAENEPVNTQVGRLSTVDPDTEDTHTYTLVTGAGDRDNEAFSIVEDQLFLKDAADFETQPSFSILVRSTDPAGLSIDTAITISTTNVNEAPIQLALSADHVVENSLDGTVIGTLSTLDPDMGDTHTYQLLDDAEGRFQLVGNQLQVADGSRLDFESGSDHAIEIISTDAAGLSRTQQMVIHIEDINEAPSDLTLEVSPVFENTPANSVIGTFSALDVDAGDTHTYAFIPGIDDADHHSFVIQGDQLLLQDSPNFEDQATYRLRVQATDQGGETLAKDFTITIADVNEAPISNHPEPKSGE